MARRLTRFVSILGLLFLAYGIAWWAILNQGAQGDLNMDWLPLDLTPPFQGRLMIVGGLLLLLVASLIRLIGRLVAEKSSVRAPRP